MLPAKRLASRGKRDLLVLDRKNARQNFPNAILILIELLFGPAAGPKIESTMVSALSMHCRVKYNI